MRRASRLAALLGLASLVAGCSTFHAAAAVRRELGPRAVVVDVPSVPKRDAQGSGLACLASLLAYHGYPVDEEARARFSEKRLQRDPIGADELRDYLRRHGFRAELVAGSLDRSYPTGLYGQVDRGSPAIVELTVGSEPCFRLVCGYEPERGLVLVMDPERGIVAIPDGNFEDGWRRAEHLMVVAAPRRSSS